MAVDSLGASTVNLKIYFWINAVESSFVKVKSLVLKNVKEALVDANVSMPDDAREVVFASPLEILKSDQQVSNLKVDIDQNEKKKRENERSKESDQDLSNELTELRQQAQQSPDAEKGENLI